MPFAGKILKLIGDCMWAIRLPFYFLVMLALGIVCAAQLRRDAVEELDAQDREGL
jgi:hypothetical protein